MPGEPVKVTLNILSGQGLLPLSGFETTQGREQSSKQIIGNPSSPSLEKYMGKLSHFVCDFF
jgi:hypothetical protein